MRIRTCLLGGLLAYGASLHAQAKDDLIADVQLDQTCLMQALLEAKNSVTVGQLRQRCTVNPAQQQVTQRAESTAAKRRIALESYSLQNPFSLTPHKPNYLLPAVYYRKNNPQPFDSNQFELDHLEVQFQLSLKFMVWRNLFGTGGNLFGAYTNRSFWQAYNSDVSSPFRETNHEPELILAFLNDWTVFGFTNVLNQVSLNHQSNGRSSELSRSWNRIIFTSAFERGNFAFAFSPWYRLPEQQKTDPNSSDGDDNPDIEDYLGHFDLTAAYTRNNSTYSTTLRNNLSSDNKGSLELGWSFPINHTLRGYVRYFNGYGESLLDYDQRVESIGVGIQLSDWL